MRNKVTTGIAIALLAVSTACGGTVAEIEPATEPEPVAETSEPAPDPEPEPAPKPEPEPEPDGEITARCDSLLNSDLDLNQDGRYKFVATLDAENTGNIGIEAEVWVEFNQIGAEPVRYTETVTLTVGETATVYVDENANRDQWRRYMDAGAECNIGMDLVDTFGTVSD